MSYPGLRGNHTYRNKYAGCEHSKLRGGSVRLLSQPEIDEFRARVNAIISLRSTPKPRRSNFT
jgi:hypothetical protein